MVNVTGNIFIGNRSEIDWIADNLSLEKDNPKRYSLCLCAKTFHKMVAKMDGSREIGYNGNMPKDQKEYLIAERPESHMIAVNLIDAPKVEYVPDEIINKCLEFIDNEISQGRKVAIMCDKGESRSACIAFMWFIKNGCFNDCDTFEKSEEKFRIFFYDNYNPNNGMREYTRNYFYEMRG